MTLEASTKAKMKESFASKNLKISISWRIDVLSLGQGVIYSKKSSCTTIFEIMD